MRIHTKEEERLFRLLDNENLSSEERQKIIDKLKEIEQKETNGMDWLT